MVIIKQFRHPHELPAESRHLHLNRSELPTVSIRLHGVNPVSEQVPVEEQRETVVSITAFASACLSWWCRSRLSTLCR